MLKILLLMTFILLSSCSGKNIKKKISLRSFDVKRCSSYLKFYRESLNESFIFYDCHATDENRLWR